MKRFIGGKSGNDTMNILALVTFRINRVSGCFAKTTNGRLVHATHCSLEGTEERNSPDTPIVTCRYVQSLNGPVDHNASRSDARGRDLLHSLSGLAG